LNSESPSDQNLAKNKLTRWQVDPDLAGIRNPSALQLFSQDEREEWGALWRKVAAVLKRAHTKK
jgi:hypothetical protein